MEMPMSQIQIPKKIEETTLFSKLQKTFPTKTVLPFGEVVVIPSRKFVNGWKETLESEGVKALVSNCGSEAVFFLRKADHKEHDSEPSPVKEKLKPHVWTPEEETTLKTLHIQGVSAKEIAEKLGFSVYQIGAKIRHLPKPQTKHEEKADPETKEAAAQTSPDDSLIKEFLTAASVLYPQYRRASAFLLREVSNKVEQSP